MRQYSVKPSNTAIAETLLRDLLSPALLFVLLVDLLLSLHDILLHGGGVSVLEERRGQGGDGPEAAAGAPGLHLLLHQLLPRGPRRAPLLSGRLLQTRIRGDDRK